MGQTAALINGRAFSYTDITLVALGGSFPGLQTLNYEFAQDKAFNYGTSPKAVSIGYGKKAGTGSMQLSMNDIEALRDAAPNGSILDIPASDFIIAYTNPQKPVTHILKSLVFTNDGNDGSIDDTDLLFTLNFVFADLKTR